MLRTTKLELGNEFNNLKTDWLRNVIGEKIPFSLEYEVETAVKFWSGNPLTYNPDEFITSDYIQSEDNSFSEFYEQDVIRIVDVDNPSNNGDYTIFEKKSPTTLRLKKGAIAANFTQAIGSNCKIFVVSVVDKIKFNFNFIENNEGVNFTSKITGTLQEAEKDLLDATDTSTIVNLIPQGEKSWQIGNLLTKLSDLKIVGMGIDTSSTYISKFKITGTLWLTPFFLTEQWDDLIDDIAPSYYYDFKCLKLVYSLRAAYKNRSYQFSQNFTEDKVFGDSAWFNETFDNSPTNYYVDSCVFKRTDTTVVPSLELTTNEIDFTIVVKNTVDSPFKTLQPYTLNFIVALDDPDKYSGNDYKNNTLDFNFRFDRLLTTVDASVTNGELHGVTGRKVFEGVSAVLNSSSQITITGKIIADSTLVAFLQSLNEPRYIIWVTTSKILTEELKIAAESPITVQDTPQGICVNPNTGYIYVANVNSNSVSVINSATGLVIKTIASLSQALDVVYNSINNEVWVSCYGAGGVRRIDCLTDTVTGSLISANTIVYLAFDPVNNRIYGNSSSGVNVIYSIDCSSFVVTTIAIGSTNAGYGVFYYNGKVYVQIGTGTSSVKVVTTSSNTITATISLPSNTNFYNFELNTINSKIYAVDVTSGILYVINPSTDTIFTTVASIGNNSFSIRYRVTYNLFFISNQSINTVSVFNPLTNALTGFSISVTGSPRQILIYNEKVYVCCASSGEVAVLDLFISTSSDNDRVALLVSAKDYYQDFTDASMIVPSNIFLRLPEVDPTTEGVNPLTDIIEAFPNDIIVAASNFYIESSGRTTNEIIITSVQAEIIAKNGDDEFELDQFLLQTDQYPLIGYTQQFDAQVARIFKVNEHSIRKYVEVKRRNDLDTGTRKYFSSYYPFMIRWETWTAMLGVDPVFFDSTKPNNGFNEWWYQYGQISGWTINYRLTVNATKDSKEQTYSLINEININDYASNSAYTIKDVLPFDANTLTALISGIGGAKQLVVGGSANFTINGQVYYTDGTNFFYTYNKNLIVAIFTKTSSTTNYTVEIGVELYQNGGIAGRRNYNSKYASEGDTWFSSIDGDGKVKTYIYGNTVIGLCYLDPNTSNFPTSIESFTFDARIYDNVGAEALATDDGVIIQTDEGVNILID